MKALRPLSLDIAAWAAGCALVLLFWVIYIWVDLDYKESQEKSRRLLIETDRLATCCFDTTTISMSVSYSFQDAPIGTYRIITSRWGEVTGKTRINAKIDTTVHAFFDTIHAAVRVKAEVSDDTTAWVSLKAPISPADSLEFKKLTGKRWLRFRVRDINDP